MKPKPIAPDRRSFALVSTLLVIAILSIMVVSFLSSMRIEKLTSRSYAHISSAQLAAESAVDDAASRIISLLTQYPYHASGYVLTNSADANVANPAVYPVICTGPSFSGIGAPRPFLTTNYLLSVPTNALTMAPVLTNAVVINEKLVNQTNGWVGVPFQTNGVGYANYNNYQMRAPWINVLRDPSLPNQPDPSRPNYNPIVARYAFWVEDETAKVDVSVAGNTNGISGAFARTSGGTNDVDVVTNRVQFVDLGAIPLRNNRPLGNDTESINLNQKLVQYSRSLNPVLPDPLLSNGAVGTNLVENVKYHTTIYSRSLELAGTGRRRVNLNALVTNGNDPQTPASKRFIAGDLDDLIYVITGTHPFSGLGLNNVSDQTFFADRPVRSEPLPEFGDRLTFESSVTNRRDLYLKRIAANLRDYLDQDRYPTIVDDSGAVLDGTASNNLWVNQPQAIGKEAIPYLQEHAWHGYLHSMTGPVGGYVTATISIDHYLEFFNPSTKDWVAPSNTKIYLSNLPTWQAGAGDTIDIGTITLDLSGQTVPAGRCLVVTTQPSASADPPNLFKSGFTNIYRASVPNNKRYFSEVRSNLPINLQGLGFRMTPPDSSSTTYYGTRFLWRSGNGIFDGFQGVSISLSDYQFNFTNRLPADIANPIRFLYSSSLRGNDMVSRSGDPRSLSEYLELYYLTARAGSSNYDQARFYQNLGGNAAGNNSFGQASISFVNPAAWPDLEVAFQDSAATAYAVIRDGPMASIGELGHIYDPHRKLTSESRNVQSILYARGGGRTLKVGQPDDLCNSTRFGPATTSLNSWFQSAWRLCDLFAAESTTRYSPTSDLRNAVSDPVQRGKINLNGVLRDEGVAFRAVLRNLAFQNVPGSDPNLAGRTLSDAEINKLVGSIKLYLTTNGPFMERGELSQISYFNASSAETLGGLAFSSLNNRGREELFRRVVELITTRSASYTVYAVGQAVRQQRSGKIEDRDILSTQRRRCLLTFEPRFNGTSATATTHPDEAVSGYSVNRFYYP